MLPNGLAIGCTEQYSSSVSDLVIFKKNLDWHKGALQQTEKEEEEEIIDLGTVRRDSGESWAVVMDKGYQGTGNEIREIFPKKKPKGGVFKMEEVK